MSRFQKLTTGLTGLKVVKDPARSLLALYEKIEREIAKMPPSAGYRKNTQAIMDERIAHVNAEPDIAKLEQRIKQGHIEEVIQQAEMELQTARAMNMYKSWEEPVLQEPPGQWKWP